MKKINLLSISVITIMALASCGGVQKSPIETAIENLRQSFTLEGEIYQKAKFLDGYDGAYTGEEADHNFTYSYAMENGVESIKKLADYTTFSVTEMIERELNNWVKF